MMPRPEGTGDPGALRNPVRESARSRAHITGSLVVERCTHCQETAQSWQMHKRNALFSVRCPQTSCQCLSLTKASQMALLLKDLPANAGDVRDAVLTPGSGRSPGGGHGNPLQYSCLENPMDRKACLATVHEIAKSQTQLK